MAWEIERKFLVKNDSWRSGVERTVKMIQGYIAGGAGIPTVRVRIAGDRGILTIKGKAAGLVRSEFEYEIPLADARFMLDNLCGTRVVEKTRSFCGRWEIDEYAGLNAGLLTAEIELDAPDEAFERPEWLGEEVSDEPAYTNSSLSRRPYSTWEKENERPL
ncbi:MAG: CYTH domain-containing protein [Lentisphaeria bacterium]|nr:CYTH domain-containing protein [Lentisphaeria bacterium]